MNVVVSGVKNLPVKQRVERVRDILWQWMKVEYADRIERLAEKYTAAVRRQRIAQ
jgi:hypothetical protein